MKKKILRAALFVFILAAAFTILYFADRLMCPKTEHGIRQTDYFYAQPKDTIDVIFMGSSHIHYDANTALLWQDYGMAAYDLSGAEQPLWITYYYLKELCKYQSPKLIVLDLYCPARFKDDYQYNYIRDNLYGMRFSLTKLCMLMSACEPEKLFDYFPGFGDYHNRIDELDDEDWSYFKISRNEKAAYKGFSPHFDIEPQPEPLLDITESGGLTEKSEKYLRKIIEFADKKDIKLYLILAPYPAVTDDDERTLNSIRAIADEYGVPFDDMNREYDVIGLDFDKDFNDVSHLNYSGSIKFTKYLADIIKERYEIPDRRGDKRYSSWDTHVAWIKELASGENSSFVIE